MFKQVSSSGAAARDGRLQVGMRILEVNNHSLLGMTHTEAVRVLRAVGDSLGMLVCDGFDPRKVAAVEVRHREQSDLNKVLCHIKKKQYSLYRQRYFYMFSVSDRFPGVSWHHCQPVCRRHRA